MERIKALIQKLQQQADQQGDTAAMMVTVQLLQAELTKISTVVQVATPSKISVVLPGGAPFFHTSHISAPEPEPAIAAVHVAEAVLPPVPREAPTEIRPVPSRPVLVAEPEWIADPLAEIPSLAEQKVEMNELWGRPAPSLNDRLKTERTELGSMHTEAPVKDLKKAIGINDRFVFLNELFRGDEVMYERSIKTINNFRAYPEAEYWIERELKIKLGWDENKEAVKYFRQLVSRRFY